VVAAARAGDLIIGGGIDVDRAGSGGIAPGAEDTNGPLGARAGSMGSEQR